MNSQLVTKSRFLSRAVFVGLFAIACTGSITAHSASLPPSLSSSTPALAGSLVNVSGFSFAPSSKVSVVVVSPSGATQSSAEYVDSNGALTYSLDVSVAGAYRVDVVAEDGRVLASTKVNALAPR